MKLTFGDLAAKAALEKQIQEEQLHEKRVAIAKRNLENTTYLPADDAALWEFPPHLQSWGLRVLRDAVKQIRTERGQ
jgi:hypothetical protein